MKKTGFSRFDFFMDEAGHTGDDLVKSDQHFFTLASIGLQESDQKIIEKKIPKLKTKYGIEFELKGNKLIGKKFEPIIKEIFEELSVSSYLPIFTVLEKRFMIVARIIENYFDPAYNDHTDETWTHPLPFKAELANYFYDSLSDNTINITAAAMQRGKIEDVLKAYEDISKETSDKQIKRLLRGAEPHLNKLSEGLLQAFSNNLDNTPGPVLNSPNYTIYFEHLNKIEDYLRKLNTSGKIVFDSSRQMNESFNALFERLKNLRGGKQMNFGRSTLYFGFDKIESFSFSDSGETVFLQLADLLATSVNSFFRKMETKDSLWKLTDNEEFWMGYIYILMDHNYGNWIVSKKIKYKYGRFIKEYLKTRI